MTRTDGWVFIVNPVAGNGFGASCVPVVKEMMERHGADGEVVLTRGKGHATELAADKSFESYFGAAPKAGETRVAGELVQEGQAAS